MALETQSEFIFLGRGDEGFLENYSYALDDDASGAGGQLFMSLEILNNDGEAEEIGEGLFDVMKNAFYEKVDQDVYERFEDAVKVLNAHIEELRNARATRFIGNVNVLLAGLVGNRLVLTASGDAEAYLVRKRMATVISDGLVETGKNADGEIFMNVAEGELEFGDTIVLSSTRLVRYITKQELGRTVGAGAEEDLKMSMEDLADSLATEILGRASVVGIHIKQHGQLAIDEVEEGSAGIGEFSITEDKTTLKGKIFHKMKGIFSFTDKIMGSSAKDRLRQHFRGRDAGKDRILMALVAVIIILVGGIFWLRHKGLTSQQLQDYETKLNNAQEMISDAATQGQFDRDKGAALLGQAEKEILEVLNTRFLRSKAGQLMNEIEKQRMLLDNVQIIDTPEVFVDLTEKDPDVNMLGMIFLTDRLFTFDVNMLYEIVLDRIQEPRKIDDAESVVLAAPFEDQRAVVMMTRSGKVIEFRDGQFHFMDTADAVWKKGVNITTYNDRLYVLDPERNQIWRYRRQRDAYGVADGANIDADVKNGVAFSIDGAIYVLNSDGSITTTYAGETQAVPVEDSPFSPVIAPTQIYTDVDLNQLFVLEPSTGRVVGYFKDRRAGGAFPEKLTYTTQYIFKGTGELRALYISKDENKLYVADSTKIYVTDLAR